MAYEAGRIVVELEARSGQLDATMRNSAQVTEQAMSRVERSATQAERAIQRSSAGIVVSTGQVGQATRNLGFQISDVGQQLSGGQSPFLIFGQQAPQFAQAFDDIAASGANLGTVLRSIALPGILAVVSVLATLIERQYQAADAQGRHKGATDALTEAVDRLSAAAARNNHQTEIGIQLDLKKAEAQRQVTIRTRERIAAELNRQKTELSAEQVNERFNPVGIPGRGAASRQANISDLNRQLADNAAAIKKADEAIAVSRTALILRGVAAQTDAAAAATQRYENRIDSLSRRFQGGAIDQGTFERLALAATRERDAALDTAKASDRASTSARGHSVSLRVQSDGAREAAAAQRELENALTSLARKYDPVTSAAADYAAELKKIADLQSSGALTADQADLYRTGAQTEYRKTRAGLFTLDSVEELRPGAEQDERDAKDAARAAEQAAADAERNSQLRREDNIRSLANLYEDVFTRSSGTVWDNFKRDGLRALAVVLAQATVTSFSKGGGGFGSLLGNISKAAGAVFGASAGIPRFATGGSMVIGGMGGTDQNLLSLNGQPIAAVSRGETLNISPGAQAVSQSGRQMAMTPQQVDVRVFLSDDIDARIDGRSAGMSVQVLRGAMPDILQAATVNTVSELRKPGL